MKKLARITLPKAKYGTSTNPINSARALSPGAFYPSGDSGESDVSINSTLKPVPRDMANLEAEKGETVVTNLAQTGIPEFYKISGKRHFDGGTPLNLPQDSFIFSRDNKMRIKDPAVLSQFGMTMKKGSKKGFTPAEISKKYDINVYRKILADPSSDKFQIETAESMIRNYNIKLGQLALIQESIKGYPNGIPGIAMPYLEFAGIDPEQLVKIPGQEGGQQQGGQQQFVVGGENDNEGQIQGAVDDIETKYLGINTDRIDLLDDNPTEGELRAVKKEVPAVWDANKQFQYISGPDYTPPENNINPKQQGIVDYYTKARGESSGFKTGEQFFKDVQRDTGEVYSYAETDEGSEWAFDRAGTDAYAQELRDKAVAEKEASDAGKASDFKPGFEWKDGKLYQKRATSKIDPETGQNYHLQASNAAMATMYAKRYATEKIDSKELQKQIRENPELFASTYGQKAAKDAQVASLTLEDGRNILRKFGGDIPKYQTTGEVKPNENQYTQGIRYDKNTPSESDYTQGLGFGTPQTGETFDAYWQRTAGTLPFKPDQRVWNGQEWVPAGTVPQLASRSTSTQRIPEDAVTWDMGEPGYDEKEVQPGDYVRKKDGKWYQVTGYSNKKSAYTGRPLDPKLKGAAGDLTESYGRLEQRIMESPELQDAIVIEYHKAMKKARPGRNLSEADLKAARELEPDQIISNFFRAQKQIMGIQAHKGKIEENVAAWDTDKSHYINTAKELGYTPMNSVETAAFQGAYIGLQKLSDDPKYKEHWEDFRISKTVRTGEDDESGELSGHKDISEVDGWFGNTTVGQSALYYPEAKELEFKETEWKKAVDKKSVKHMANTSGFERTPFWTEDIINGSFALRNLWNIQKETPWNAIPGVKLPNPTFLTPDQQIQNILGASGQAAQAAASFGSPQAFAANTAALQANAMQSVSNAIGTVHDKNVQIANQFQLHRTQILNQANNTKAQLATNLHDKNTILNQQYSNAKNQAWDEVRQGMVNMWTNRGKTQTMNEMTDNFSVDPRTGFTYKTHNRDVTPKNANQQDLYDLAKSYKRESPDMDWRSAVTLAKNSKGIPESPTGYSGMDPLQTGLNYPGSIPSYYPEEGQ